MPGLGHAYARAYVRAVCFAVLPLAGLGLIGGLLLRYGLRDFGLWVGQTSVVGPLVVLNLLLLGYRAFATVDAYRIVVGANADANGAYDGIPRHHRPRFRVNPMSLAGLTAILFVMAAGHAYAGYWDLKLYRTLEDIHSPIAIASPSPNPAGTVEPVVTFPPQQAIPPAPTFQPWDSKARLNILLVGVDEQGGGFRTDTMIVVSLDPSTHQVAMFSMPRDTYGLPMPPNSRLSALWGPNFNYKANALWEYSDRYRDLFPGGGADALKQALGYAFGLDIQYYVLVDFSGFQKVVDALGGVTVNVPVPVVDDGYPGNNGDGQHLRVYIPAGIQHMDGSEALTYARSRKGSAYYDDYNRSARQEQILVDLEQQANIGEVSAHLGELMDALSQTIHTDIPEGPSVVGPLLDQARYVALSNIKTYAFSPSGGYGVSAMIGASGSQTSVFLPDVASIRAEVASVIAESAKGTSESRTAADEQAPIVVENGSGVANQAANLAAYLRSLGLAAQEGADSAGQLGGSTQVIAVNRAESEYPATLAVLLGKLGLSGPVSAAPDAAVRAISDSASPPEFIVVTGSNTPILTAPPGT
jgi:LCP family protein required for cell wall assembly